MTLIQIVQATSAVYILVLAAVGSIALLRAAADEDAEVATNVTGFPAVVLALAVLVCAITTIGAL
jgi:hypothetical protein